MNTATLRTQLRKNLTRSYSCGSRTSDTTSYRQCTSDLSIAGIKEQCYYEKWTSDHCRHSICGYRRRKAEKYRNGHAAGDLDVDLRAAGIDKHGPGGKIDFHACRLAYINFVLEAGVSVKEAQTLARHATPEMTLNVYGRTREDRLADAVERVASKIQTTDDLQCAPSVHRIAVGAEHEYATPSRGKDCVSSELVEAASTTNTS